jgi:hypothetical protein
MYQQGTALAGRHRRIQIRERFEIPNGRCHLREWQFRSAQQRLALVLQDDVEQPNRRRIARAVRMTLRVAPGQHEARRTFPQHAGEARYEAAGNSGDPAYLGVIVGLDGRDQRRGQIARVILALQQLTRKTQREHAFGARRDDDPPIGVRAGQRHLGFDLHEHTARCCSAKAGVLPRGGNRRVAGAEKIVAERQHEPGFFDQADRLVDAK